MPLGFAALCTKGGSGPACPERAGLAALHYMKYDPPEKQHLPLPLFIPPEEIGLPTRGARITKCTFFHAGDADPEPFAQMYHFAFSADTFRFEGEIEPVDPEAPAIHFEAGLPAEWNGKAIQYGGAGLDGFVSPCTMHFHGQYRTHDTALEKGFVVFSSDGGHEAVLGNFMDCRWIRNRESFENFAHQSLKKTKDAVAYLVRRFYGRAAEKVYFYGGSNGGRECLKALQQYAQDYDGAVCFFPVLYWVQKVLMDARNVRALTRLGKEARIDQETQDRILAAEKELCDGQDGARDGLISNKEAARENRAMIQAALERILTKPQAQALEVLSRPLHLPFPLAFGNQDLPGYPVYEGTAAKVHFDFLDMAEKAGTSDFSSSLIANLFAGDPAYDTAGFRAEDWKERLQECSFWLDACSTDLDAFADKGGKLILVQGTDDPQVNMYGTIEYYQALQKKYGAQKTNSFLRFYLIPGFGHGTDGDFLAMSDFIGAIDRWVEEKRPPEAMTVEDESKAHAGRTRPLCEYPKYPRYRGKGSLDLAASYQEAPQRLEASGS